MLDVGMLTKRWYKLWNRSIRRKWKRDFFTLKTKQNVLIVFVLYFIVVGFFSFVWLLKSDMLIWSAKICVFFDIHLWHSSQQPKMRPAEKSPSAAFLKKISLKIFFRRACLDALVLWSAAVCGAADEAVTQLRNMGNIWSWLQFNWTPQMH